jgi:Rrf2 family protein
MLLCHMIDTRFSITIQIMTSLAYGEGKLLSSEELALVLKTNPSFIRKLVAKLVEHDLVVAFRGKGGGIKLAKAPDKISLKEIYIASIDNKPFIFSHNKPIVKACPVSCSMAEIFCDIVKGMEDSTLHYLSKYYLSDLVDKIKKNV